jgi:uncharacterized membrane protein
MRMIWNSPVALAAITAVFYAIGTPLMRMAGLAGATNASFCTGFAASLTAFVLFDKKFDLPDFNDGKGMGLAFVVGALFAVAFRFSTRAFALPGGHTSIVAAIIGSFPVLAVLVAIAFFGEAQRVRIPAVVLGTALTASGVVIVSLFGTKP